MTIYSLKQAVKLDINIERDLAYALKVRQCPQILFLRGHKILYRESGKSCNIVSFLSHSFSGNAGFSILQTLNVTVSIFGMQSREPRMNWSK